MLKTKLSRYENILKCDMIGMSQFILLKGLHFVKAINAIIALSPKNQNRPLKGSGGKRDVWPGSSMSSGAKFPVPRRSRRL